MHSCHKGARAELLACGWLMAQGYEVFRNVSPAGPADMVVWKPGSGEFTAIQVKCSGAAGSRGILLKFQEKHNVKVLLVFPDDRVAWASNALPERGCIECGARYIPKQQRQLYCGSPCSSSACRRRAQEKRDARLLALFHNPDQTVTSDSASFLP